MFAMPRDALCTIWWSAQYLYKRRNGSLSPGMTGFGNTRSAPTGDSPVWVPASGGILSPSISEPKLTVDDEMEFRRLLFEIQTAWGRQDVQGLRRATTPEMCQYFSDKLAENVSGGIENRIEDVSMVRTDVRESWVENARIYATVLMQWTARDYVQLIAGLSESNAPGNTDDIGLNEFAEAWTFVKHQDGTWLLSAIQQSS
jgi:predicted lipid-binding transport protein (Tim44 family)